MVSAAAGQGVERRSHSTLQRAMSQLESWFERLLWASRFAMLIAVASSLLLSFAMFLRGERVRHPYHRPADALRRPRARAAARADRSCRRAC